VLARPGTFYPAQYGSTVAPAKTTFDRALVAVLHGDIVEFSRLTWQDEDAAYHALKAGFTLARRAIKDHGGNMVNTAGDSLLAVFSTATAAAKAAMVLQQQLALANQSVSKIQHLRARIGINLGEVIVDGDQAFGNGVNVAARLQEIAPPGGICISQSAREVIGNSFDAHFEFIGEQLLRHIAKPVSAYLIHASQEASHDRENAVDGTRPCILVLPFTSIDNDPSLNNLGEALTVDLISALSRFRQLFVLAPHTALAQSGRGQNKVHLGQRLGARYLIDATIRKRDDRFRLVANLLEIPAGNYLWSETYDAISTDLPAVQDRITRRVVTTLVRNIEQSAGRGLARQCPPTAYDDTIRARQLVYRMREPSDTQMARKLFQKVLKTEPGYAAASSGLALAHLADFLMMWAPDPDSALAAAAHHAGAALELDPADSQAHAVVGMTRLWHRRYPEALAHLDQAINLNPNHADALAGRGLALIFIGKPDLALTQFEDALAHNPFPPSWYLWGLAISCYNTGQYQDAVRALLRIDAPNRFHRRLLAASYAQLGNIAEAATHRESVMMEVPTYTVNDSRESQPYEHQQDVEPFIKGLIAAGFPIAP